MDGDRLMPAAHGRRIGLAPLSLLDVSPPLLVELAAKAGFDFVGLRVRSVTPTETAYDLQPGSPLLRETLARLADCDLVVEDVEFLLVDGTDQRDDWLRVYEAGHALGASTLTVAVSDPDLSRAAATLARMAEDGRAAGIVPTIEPISYQAVHSLPTAHRLARQTGCGVLVDTLHVARFGGTAEELEAVAPAVPLIQLCDAPEAAPTGLEELVQESRSGRLSPGAGDLALVEVVAAVEAGRRETVRAQTPLPVSVEVPDLDSRRGMDDLEWARHLYRAARRTLEGVAFPGPGHGSTEPVPPGSAETP